MLQRRGVSLALKLTLAVALMAITAPATLADDEDVLIIDEGEEAAAKPVEASPPSNNALFIGKHQSLLGVDTGG